MGDGGSSRLDDESSGEHRCFGIALTRIGGVWPMIDIRLSGGSERWAEHDRRRWPTTRSHRALPPASQLPSSACSPACGSRGAEKTVSYRLACLG
jgi:hypothetical protein